MVIQMDQIEIKIQVPKVVDQLWRALGYDETDYQYDFLESQYSGVRVSLYESYSPVWGYLGLIQPFPSLSGGNPCFSG